MCFLHPLDVLHSLSGGWSTDLTFQSTVLLRHVSYANDSEELPPLDCFLLILTSFLQLRQPSSLPPIRQTLPGSFFFCNYLVSPIFPTKKERKQGLFWSLLTTVMAKPFIHHSSPFPSFDNPIYYSFSIFTLTGYPLRLTFTFFDDMSTWISFFLLFQPLILPSVIR